MFIKGFVFPAGSVLRLRLLQKSPKELILLNKLELYASMQHTVNFSMCLCLNFSDVKHNLKDLLILLLQTDGLLQLCYGADVESGGSHRNNVTYLLIRRRSPLHVALH